jgi:hypothetical protein
MRELLEEVANLQLPDKTVRRLQELMDRNNEGQLTETERKELESLVEVNESLALVRGKALIVLGRKP